MTERRDNIVNRRSNDGLDSSPFSVISYSLSENAHVRIREVIHDILERRGKNHLKDSIYTIIKEMAINGTKANMKRLIFEEEGIEATDREEYERGITIFRDRLSEDWLEKYDTHMAKQGLTVQCKFIETHDRLIVEVVNNVPVFEAEAERIRAKLSECMGYESLMDFYVHHADETEGEGLGFSMIVILLKNENLDPHLFTIDTSRTDRTVAKLEIPLDEEALTSRELWDVDKSEDD